MADATPTAPVIFKKRAGRANLKKRAATPPSASDSDYSSAEDESGARIKRRRKGGITTSTSSAITKPVRDLGKSTQFTGDRSAAITNLDDATKTSNWFHADEAAKGPEAEGDVEKDGTYKGAKGYGNFIQKNPDKLGKSVGPVKAPTNMRMITLVDFAPDVCKDYKQTGFVSSPSPLHL
jgi:RING finger protein 113A